MSRPVWITATPPTPNGELHVGHMAGPYLAGDVLRRFLAREGRAVRFTTGLDDYQSYVPVRALRENRKAEEAADDYGDRIMTAWCSAGAVFDRIVRPRTDTGYELFVQRFFQWLYDDGAIVARTRPLPYCVLCERWLYEAYVVGGCPHCGSSSNGNACEPCGCPNECGDLVDPRCTTCDAAAELRDCERLFLPLAPFEERLRAFWAGVSMPPHLRALVETMADAGLPEIAVSHPGSWGLPVPVAGFTDQRIYVWFEMAPGYLLEYDVGGTTPQTGPVQFFGFDNGYFHAVLFPAMFLAYDPAIPLPRAFIVNEFYRLEGRKFSTSRQHAVWALEALAEFGADALRYHVFADRPNGRQTSFERGDLAAACDHLHTTWNGWLARLFAAVADECGGVVPSVPPSGPEWTVLKGRLARILVELREAYSVAGFDPRRTVALLDEVVRLVTDFGYVQDHHRARPTGRKDYRAGLTGQLAVASALAAWAAPVLPHGAERLARLLGVASHRPVTVAALTPPPVGTVLGTSAEPVFGGRGR